MKKSSIIMTIVIVVAVIGAIILAVVLNSNKSQEVQTKLGEINSSKDLKNIVEKVYEGNDDLPHLETSEINVSDDDMVKAYTGLDNGKDLEYLVVSEPLMSSQAYSFVLAKVKSGVDANKIAREMNENINERKWICVSAEKIYSTSSGNVVCLVMSNAETAKTVYDKFKKVAETVGQEYERSESEIELPPQMFVVE